MIRNKQEVTSWVDQGKKDEKAERAKAASQGKFASGKPPVLKVGGEMMNEHCRNCGEKLDRYSLHQCKPLVEFIKRKVFVQGFQQVCVKTISTESEWRRYLRNGNI